MSNPTTYAPALETAPAPNPRPQSEPLAPVTSANVVKVTERLAPVTSANVVKVTKPLAPVTSANVVKVTKPLAPVTSDTVREVTERRDRAGKIVTASWRRNLTPEDAKAANSAASQGAERLRVRRAAATAAANIKTGSKLAIIGALASTATTLVKDVPLVGGAIAGAIMLFQMGAERYYVGQQARAEAKDILHNLTYSYLLFKLIDIGADKLGLVLDIEIIQEGIKDINEKVKAQFAERPAFFKDPKEFIKYQSRNPKTELDLLHKALDEFRDNMEDLYTSFDILKEANELLPTLKDTKSLPKRYTGVSPDALETLIAWFKTAAARELDDSEVSEVMDFLEKKLMTSAEKKAKNATERGADVVPSPDKTFTTASKNATSVSPSTSSSIREKAASALNAASALTEWRGGALWPPKYYRGLSTRRKGQRRREITRRAKMSHKNPAAYRPFATDRGTRRRPSSYSSRFHTKYPGVTGLPAIAKATGVPQSVLEKVYDRGLAAWRTGHRPGASQHAWGMARVHSFVLHGKTWRTADADLARRNSSH
jgi:hypothetical protein